MQQKSDSQLEAKLDNNAYDDTQLLELKVPINLPYQATWADYQRYNGEIEIKGILYKYVKRKVADDTLYVMCIPNTSKMHFKSVKDNFFNITNDLLGNSKKSGNSRNIQIKFQQNDYDHSFALITFLATACSQNCWLTAPPLHLVTAPHVSPEQPPDSNRV